MWSYYRNSYNFNASTSSQSDPNDKILIHQKMSNLKGRQRKRSALDREAEKDHTKMMKKISLQGNRCSEINHSQKNNSTAALIVGGVDNKAGSLPRVRISEDAVIDRYSVRKRRTVTRGQLLMEKFMTDWNSLAENCKSNSIW